MDNIAISIVRTVIPYLVGYLATLGITLSNENLAALSNTLAFFIAVAYYAVVRIAERRYPKVGVLLGIPAKPTYTGDTK